MAKKISEHTKATRDSVRMLLGIGATAASETGNEPIRRAVDELRTLESPTKAQVDSVVALTEDFIRANNKFAATTKAEAAQYRQANDLEDGEPVNRAEARTYSGEPFNQAATRVRAVLLAVGLLIQHPIPELA